MLTPSMPHLVPFFLTLLSLIIVGVPSRPLSNAPGARADLVVLS